MRVDDAFSYNYFMVSDIAYRLYRTMRGNYLIFRVVILHADAVM